MHISNKLLKRLRNLRGMKQQHVAELIGVTQATVSRWESGSLAPNAKQRALLIRHLALTLKSTHDAALKRLVETSTLKVHLVCDRTHLLLAASKPRQEEWRLELSELIGRSMIVYASPEILAAEATLRSRGWFDCALSSLGVTTGPNCDGNVPIRRGRMIWERIALSDGSMGRLVTTVA
jgi:transcriptional regulator with XRE-family HTH domain